MPGSGPRAYRHPIYGTRKDKRDTCDAMLQRIYQAYNTLLRDVEKLISTRVDDVYVQPEIIAEMGAKAYVSSKLYVRLLWRTSNPNSSFNSKNRYHRVQILLLYANLNLLSQAVNDPLFKDEMGISILSDSPFFELQSDGTFTVRNL